MKLTHDHPALALIGPQRFKFVIIITLWARFTPFPEYLRATDSLHRRSSVWLWIILRLIKRGNLSEKGKDWRPYDQFRTLTAVSATIQFVAREIFRVDTQNHINGSLCGFESYINRIERFQQNETATNKFSLFNCVFFYRWLTFYRPALLCEKLLEDTYLRATRLYQSSVKLQRFVNLSRKRTLHLQAKLSRVISFINAPV